jgi:hypothetical protein
VCDAPEDDRTGVGRRSSSPWCPVEFDASSRRSGYSLDMLVVVSKLGSASQRAYASPPP